MQLRLEPARPLPPLTKAERRLHVAAAGCGHPSCAFSPLAPFLSPAVYREVLASAGVAGQIRDTKAAREVQVGAAVGRSRIGPLSRVAQPPCLPCTSC